MMSKSIFSIALASVEGSDVCKQRYYLQVARKEGRIHLVGTDVVCQRMDLTLKVK
jgi:hypothetical protein